MTTRPNLVWTQDPNDLPQFLRQVRIAKGMQQLELAKQLGHTPGFIANVEAGRQLPSTPTLFGWMRILGIEFMARRKEEN